MASLNTLDISAVSTHSGHMFFDYVVVVCFVASVTFDLTVHVQYGLWPLTCFLFSPVVAPLVFSSMGLDTVLSS